MSDRFEPSQLELGLQRISGAALSPHTKRAYSARWRDFAAWSESNRTSPLSADDSTVARYLSDCRSRHASAATRKIAIYAIRLGQGSTLSIRRRASPALRREMVLGRRETKEGRELRPLYFPDVRHVTAAIDLSEPQGLQDRFLFLLSWVGALRTEEAAALRWRDITAVPGGLKLSGLKYHAHVEYRYNLKNKPVPLIAALPEEPQFCPLIAYETWREAADAADRLNLPVFHTSRRGKPRALASATFKTIVRCRLAQAGFRTDYTHRSLRDGFIVAMLNAGRHPLAVARLARIATASSLNRYQAFLEGPPRDHPDPLGSR